MGNMVNEMKSISKSAKKRLMNGYWEERYGKKCQAEKELLIVKLKTVVGELFNERQQYESYKRFMVVHLPSTEKNNQIFDSERLADRIMYEKVCQNIEDYDGLNPISCIIDRTYYETLNHEQKEVYIKLLKEKYRNFEVIYRRNRTHSHNINV